MNKKVIRLYFRPLAEMSVINFFPTELKNPRETERLREEQKGDFEVYSQRVIRGQWGIDIYSVNSFF